MKVANKISSDEITMRISHLPDSTKRDMLNWLRITKRLSDAMIAEAAEQCGIHPKYAFRGIWDDCPVVPYAYLWHMHWLPLIESRSAP